MKKIAIITPLLALMAIMFMAFISADQDVPPWDIPDKYMKMKNDVTADKESISIGKELYVQHCKSCHGKEGLGDGTKAAQLDTPCGDFTMEEFWEQSDGEMFYKSYIGRDEMPNFEKKIPDPEDIWHVINYMKTFAE